MEWRKATYSVENGNCVEVASAGAVLIRDTQDRDGVTLTVPARAEAACDLAITPTGPCRRQPFAAELSVEGQPFGQIAEALVSIGSLLF